jgi:fatty-acyl-CoA synthase
MNLRRGLDLVLPVVRRVGVTADAVRSSGLLGALRPLGVASFVLDSLGTPKNPSRIIHFHACNTPHKPALVDGGVRLSYRQLDERINRLAHSLLAMGVKPGDRVGLMMRNCHEYLETQWACNRIGGIAVQIGYRLKAAEVAYILAHSEPRVVVAQEPEAAVVSAAMAEAKHPAPDKLIVVGPAYEAVLARGATTLPRVDTEERSGVMIYTSGTTGKPKGASRDFKRALHESIADFLRKVGVKNDERHLVVCPLYHSAAPAFCAFVFGVGGTVVLGDHFEPAAVLQLIAREKITSAFLVPTMLGRLAAEARPGDDASSLRWVASGAAPLPTETARRFEERFGRILFNFYGATETGMVTLAGPGEHTARPGTIGRALSGNEIRLLDEQGHDVPAGQVGELYVRNSMLVGGYHRDQGATEKAMREGFFSVGDLARVDPDGYYYLADRKHDMVISGGVNIYPLEIEERLHTHPGVLECAVVGVPDAEWGEALKAFVVLRPGAAPSSDELRAFCKETLANYKCPKTIEFLEVLPRNPTGKVLKRELRQRA